MSVQDRYQTFVDDQRAFFDELITENWDTYFSKSWDETRRYEIARLFQMIKPKAILDIGCGCGFHDQEMASYPFVTRVDAFDYSSKSVGKADEAYPHPKITRWVGDFAVDVPKQRYDLVVSFQVFEHLSDPKPYFNFCRAACAPGGYVAIFTPNRLRLRNCLRVRKGLPLELLDPQHFKEYVPNEIVEMGRQAGLLPFATFGYGLDGHSLVDKLSNRRRLSLGRLLAPLASGFCVIHHARA